MGGAVECRTRCAFKHAMRVPIPAMRALSGDADVACRNVGRHAPFWVLAALEGAGGARLGSAPARVARGCVSLKGLPARALEAARGLMVERVRAAPAEALPGARPSYVVCVGGARRARGPAQRRTRAAAAAEAEAEAEAARALADFCAAPAAPDDDGPADDYDVAGDYDVAVDDVEDDDVAVEPSEGEEGDYESDYESEDYESEGDGESDYGAPSPSPSSQRPSSTQPLLLPPPPPPLPLPLPQAPTHEVRAALDWVGAGRLERCAAMGAAFRALSDPVRLAALTEDVLPELREAMGAGDREAARALLAALG